MVVSLLFWLGLAFPGYVIVRHFWKDDLGSGFLGVAGLSYLATLGLLSPVSILCYVFEFPVSVFSTACVLAMLAAVLEIARRGWWKEWWPLLRGALSVGLVIVIADMVLGMLVGGQTGGDGALHLTRIRQLLEHGFTNTDPFVSVPYFFSTYHTNLLHALHAACSQITGVHHVSEWFMSVAWAKLLIASGAYYLAWSVFDRHWPAWVAAVFVVGCQGPITFVLYPNKLAPYWVAPMLMGLAIRALRSPCSWRSPLKLAVGSLVLGQVHSLYGAFAALALGPVLGVAALAALVRRRGDARRLAVCLLAITATFPFLWISKKNSNPISAPARQAATSHGGGVQPATVPRVANGFRYYENGWVAMTARYGWGVPRGVRGAAMTLCLMLGSALALMGSRRREAAVFLAIIGVIVLILRAPPLCTVALEVFQKEWILSRMAIFLYLGFIILVPVSMACFLESRTRFWWVRSLLTVFAGVLAVPFAQHNTPDYNWPRYSRLAIAPRETRQRHVIRTQRVVEFCERYIPRGSTILIEAFQGMVLTSIHDCHVVAPQASGNGIADIGVRREDLRALLSAGTPWPRRRELLEKYGVEHYFPAGAPTDWVRGHLKDLHRFGRAALFVIDLES